jgi:hypothetical protein
MAHPNHPLAPPLHMGGAPWPGEEEEEEEKSSDVDVSEFVRLKPKGESSQVKLDTCSYTTPKCPLR